MFDYVCDSTTHDNFGGDYSTLVGGLGTYVTCHISAFPFFLRVFTAKDVALEGRRDLATFSVLSPHKRQK